MKATESARHTVHNGSFSSWSGSRVRASVCLEGGLPLASELLDVARMDLLLLSDRPLRFGTTLQVALFCDLASGVSYNKASVHFCRATHRGWEIGAFLLQPMPDFLTARLADTVRSELRYECDWKAWVLWDQQGRLDPVRLTGYSQGGVSFRLNHRAEINSQFSLFGPGGQHHPAILNGRVCWCRAVDDGFTAGCAVAGHRGRELPRMFMNLTELHVPLTETGVATRSGDALDLLLGGLSEPECFLPADRIR